MNGREFNATLRHPIEAGRTPPHVDALVGWFGAVLAVVCALLVAIGFYALQQPAAPAPHVVPVRIADVDFAVPANWLRSASQAGVGPLERLDLVIPLPALVGAGAQEDDGPVFVTVTRAHGSMDPADRTALLYARFLAADAEPSVGGLIRRAFRSGTPYWGEDLLLSAPDGRAFAARCFKAAVAAKMKAACLTEIRFDGLDLQVRFAPAALPHREALTQALRRMVERGD